jgi:hypothetical protein
VPCRSSVSALSFLQPPGRPLRLVNIEKIVLLQYINALRLDWSLLRLGPPLKNQGGAFGDENLPSKSLGKPSKVDGAHGTSPNGSCYRIVSVHRMCEMVLRPLHAREIGDYRVLQTVVCLMRQISHGSAFSRARDHGSATS